MPNDCQLIGLDAHMFSHDGYGPGTTLQGLGPGPMSIMAEHYALRAISMRSIGNTGNLAYYMSYSYHQCRLRLRLRPRLRLGLPTYGIVYVPTYLSHRSLFYEIV